MDQTSPFNGQPTEPQGVGVVLNQGNNKKKGLFEILSIVIIIVFFLGILNYLNILKLSEMFPNQLGWLPHIPLQQSEQSNNITIAPTAIPTPSLTEKDKQTLQNFLPTVIVSSLVPVSLSDITFVQGKTNQDEYLAAWQTQDGKAAIKFAFSPSMDQITQIFVLFDYITNKPVSEDLAKNTVSKLFSQIPKEEFGCKPLSNNYNYCESFWEESDGIKRGVGIQESSPSSSSNKISAFYCQFTAESKFYSWKSCASEFAETDVTP